MAIMGNFEKLLILVFIILISLCFAGMIWVTETNLPKGYLIKEYNSNSTIDITVSKINYLLEDEMYQIETTDNMIFKTNKSGIKNGGNYTITIEMFDSLINSNGEHWKNITWVSKIEPRYTWNYEMHYYNNSENYYNWTYPENVTQIPYIFIAGGM